MNLLEIDKRYSSELITNLDVSLIARKTVEIKNEAAVNSFLGEIKTVNPLFYEKIIKEISKQNDFEKF